MTSFDWGGCALEVATPASVSGTASFDFGGMVLISTATFATVAIYEDDNTWLAAAPLADGIQYQSTLSDPGMVTLRLPLDDSLTALATPGRFFKVFRNGQIRQAAEITDDGTDLAVDGRMWRQWSNLPGVMNLWSKGCVLPEYGTDRTYSTTRTFGYMSVMGAWYRTGNWSNPADSVQFRDDTGFRQFKPAGLSYPNPWWISKRGPYHDEDPGSFQWCRHHFSTFGAEIQTQILSTGDDLVEVWLDGEKIITADQSQTDHWRGLNQYTPNLEAGLHVLAAKIRNGRNKPNPMAFILALQQLQKNGDVVTGLPITRSAPYWWVSDVLPGFRKADVLRRVFFENRTQGVAGFDLLDIGWGTVTDSNGDAFTDNPEQHTEDVGTDLLSLLQKLCEKHLDSWVDPDSFKTRLYGRKGSDKRGTVTLQRGEGSVGSILEGQVQRTRPRFTAVLVQLADTTWVEFEDSSLVATYGRSYTTVSAGTTSTKSKAQTIANHLFKQQAQNTVQITATITSLDGPQYEKNFGDGDTISVLDENGDPVPMRVMGGLVDNDRDGEPWTEVELQFETEAA